MTTAASTTFAHRLGRAVGLAVRFCIHDRNPKVRWAKRSFVVIPLLLLVASNIGWILSTILTAASLLAGVYALSKVNSDTVDFFAEDNSRRYDDDDDRGRFPPNYGEYDHPEYHLHYED